MARPRSRPIGDRAAAMLGQPRSKYMTTADVAAAFGVTRQRIGQIRREDPSFPGRQIELDGGPVWLRAGIETWAALHRPAAAEGSSFAPHGARILEAAEAFAISLRHRYVGAWDLWPALADCDATVRDVLLSLGVTVETVRDSARMFDPGSDEPVGRPFMNPRAQQLLSAGASMAAKRGSATMEPIDLAIGLIDADEIRGGTRRDAVLNALEARGLDVAELRRRLEVARDKPRAPFEPRVLGSAPRRTRHRPKHLRHLMPNPLGHDPWDRQPWGSAGASRRDERALVVDGKAWVFWIDRDGFVVRAADGRPIGYRVKVGGSHPGEPINGDVEILPMPPADVARWPDHRYGV